jgi:UDP-2,4-diacetamido-2,4,6-trideoxy-beta-L-altropyranose hydrolase
LLLIVRTDASATIGAGHVMRCLALAQAWQDVGGQVLFGCTEIHPDLSDRLHDEGMQVQTIDSDAGSLNDAQQTLALARQRTAAALVIDGYQFGQDYHDTIADFEGRTLIVDDYGQLTSYKTDFVLNQNLGADSALYSNRSDHTKLLLGTNYCLIRREFLQHPDRERTRDGSVSKILVTLGGSDPDNVTATVIRGLQLLEQPDLRFRIIAGALNRNFDQLVGMVADDSRFELLKSVRDMASQYAWADLAIAAGGSSNWEMCCFALPRILIVCADNQRLVAKELHQSGIGINLGEFRQVSSQQIFEHVSDLTRPRTTTDNDISRTAMPVDGNGAARVMSELTDLIWLRPATASDAPAYFEWVNDRSVRENSILTHQITWDEHSRWFSQKLTASDSQLFVAMWKDNSVGQIRLDRTDSGHWAIDFSVAPQWRRQGFGKGMLKALLTRLRRGERTTLTAQVKSSNISSRRCFEGLGFNSPETAHSNLITFTLEVP